MDFYGDDRKLSELGESDFNEFLDHGDDFGRVSHSIVPVSEKSCVYKTAQKGDGHLAHKFFWNNPIWYCATLPFCYNQGALCALYVYLRWNYPYAGFGYGFTHNLWIHMLSILNKAMCVACTFHSVPDNDHMDKQLVHMGQVFVAYWISESILCNLILQGRCVCLGWNGIKLRVCAKNKLFELGKSWLGDFKRGVWWAWTCPNCVWIGLVLSALSDDNKHALYFSFVAYLTQIFATCWQ